MKNKSAITLFGGTGDLTYRKLLPALYNLDVLGKLDKEFKIIVIGRRSYSQEDYINIVRGWVKEHARTKFHDNDFQNYSSRIIYFKMEMTNVEEGWCAVGGQCDRFRLVPQENRPDPLQEAGGPAVQREKSGGREGQGRNNSDGFI